MSDKQKFYTCRPLKLRLMAKNAKPSVAAVFFFRIGGDTMISGCKTGGENIV